MGRGSSKAPSGSGFPGRVRTKDVYDYDKAKASKSANLKALISDALPLGEEHTVHALILHFAEGAQSIQNGGESISWAVRGRVKSGIESVSLEGHTRDRLLSILEKKPLMPKKVLPEREFFQGKLEDFISSEEKARIVSVVTKELEMQEGALDLEGPFFVAANTIGSKKLPGMKHMKCSYDYSTKKRTSKIVAFGYDEDGLVVLFEKKIFRPK